MPRLTESETITWHLLPQAALPAPADVVLIEVLQMDSSVQVWQGHHEHGAWHDATGWPIAEGRVTAWAAMPKGTGQS